jgi:hypothetical protein
LSDKARRMWSMAGERGSNASGSIPIFISAIDISVTDIIGEICWTVK